MDFKIMLALSKSRSHLKKSAKNMFSSLRSHSNNVNDQT